MKTILAPTDFSEISMNAIDYAVEIAKLSKAKLVLFNAYRLPVVTAETAVFVPSIKELEQSSQENLNRVKQSLFQKHGNEISIGCASSCGFAVDEINLYAKENNIGLIVVGMQGAGYLSEKLIGSTTTSLMQEAECPVLSIDKHVRFKKPEKIVLACDYREPGSQNTLSPLKDFTQLFNPHVYVLNVVSSSERMPEANETAGSYASYEDALKNTVHSFHYIKDDDVINGINDFSIQRRMDMIVVIAHRYSVLKAFFSEPVSKKMAFHTSLPLLALHAHSS